MRFDAIVLAGGAARRLGGADKPMVDVGGVSLLERALAAVAGATRVVVVGPRRDTPTRVAWTEEPTPGSGPVAALSAGLELVTAPVVVVLASDLPFVARDTVADLVAAVGTGDAAVLVDDDQRDQPLSAAYGRAALGARLAALQDLCGVSVRTVLRSMSVTRVSAARAARDCDTWDDVRAARRALERPR